MRRFKNKTVFIGYTLALAIMGALYVPYETADLFRINERLTEFAKLDFSTFYDVGFKTSATPISNLLYWCVSKTENYWLLPFISGVVCFSCIFYIFNDYCKRTKASNSTVYITLLLIMSTGIYMPVIGGIRMMMAVSIASLILYREIVFKKMRLINFVPYLICVLIHEMALIVVAIRVVMLFVHNNNLKKDLRNLAILLVAALVLVGGKLLNYGTKFVTQLVSLWQNGLLNYFLENKYVDYWEYGIAIILFFVELYLVRATKKASATNNALFFLRKAMIVVLTLGAVFCWQFSLFHRCIVESGICILIPLAVTGIEQMEGNEKRNMLLLSVVLMMLSCLRGSLSALKFFVIDM